MGSRSHMGMGKFEGEGAAHCKSQGHSAVSCVKRLKKSRYRFDFGLALYAVVACLSVTSRCSTKMAEDRIAKQCHTIVRGLQFYGAENVGKTQTGSLPTEAPNAGGVGSNWLLSTKLTRYNSKSSTVASVLVYTLFYMTS